MSWLTVIWSMCAAACGVMAVLALCIGLLGHQRRANLLVVAMAIGAGAVALAEIVHMKGIDPAAVDRTLRISEWFLTALVLSIPWFVQVRFGTGRLWLAGLATVTWMTAMVLTLVLPGGLTFSEVTGLTPRTTFWGESFMQIDGIRSPLAIPADLTVVMILAHTIDASIRLWRQPGRRRQALLVGGSIVLFYVAAMAHVPLVDLGRLQVPYMIGLCFLPIVAALSLEMVFEVVASSRLSREVAANEARWRALLDNIRLVVIGTNREGILTVSYTHLRAHET